MGSAVSLSGLIHALLPCWRTLAESFTLMKTRTDPPSRLAAVVVILCCTGQLLAVPKSICTSI
eukprot:9435219-Pyramimonas_sp.AAC.1